SSSTTATPTPTPTPTPAQVVVRNLGHPLLGVTAGWELFARGKDSVLRIEPARGRITSTALPIDLENGGGVSFVVGPDWAIVRPLDAVAGYLVPDGRPARELSGALGQASQIYPGPDPGQVWLARTNVAPDPITLVAVTGSHRVLSTLAAPQSGYLVGSDGTRHLLMSSIGGVYDLLPDGAHRVTTGSVLAVGATRWLVAECDERFRCHRVVVDRSTGARRIIPGPVADTYGPSGVISPDGTTAAVLAAAGYGPPAVDLVDLATGVERVVGVTVDPGATDQPLVWSPDSRWLLGAGGSGELFAADVRSGGVRSLGVTLPTISQLAIRPAAR
ncbi:MAG: hypothetical protein QOK11_3365, partial [Pseudonocardiales bacterium]|nr:hypothetical protein [Pseudonocardiales bacterium]